MSNHQPIIEIKNLNFSYDNTTPTLEDVNFTISCGESATIVGPNGGGKTTLLKIILGILEPNSGTIKVFGKSPIKARSLIGYMPQYHQLDSAFPISVLEVVLQGTLYRGFWGRYTKNAKEIAINSLIEMGIVDLKDRSFSELSGGQRQRVLIARALACSPQLLLLDEPTASIDPKAEEQFYQTLQQLRKRLSILTVSHDLGFVHREIERVICVNHTVSIHKAVELTQENADKIYGHKVNLVKHDHSCFCNCEELDD